MDQLLAVILNTARYRKVGTRYRTVGTRYRNVDNNTSWLFLVLQGWLKRKDAQRYFNINFFSFNIYFVNFFNKNARHGSKHFDIEDIVGIDILAQ